MRVTILVALYKASEYIENKLNNLLKQTIFDDLHIILLNCENIENERDIYKPYLSDNITEIYFNSYIKLYDSWNIGIQKSKSPYISNSNADDLLQPTYYEKCAEFLDNTDYAMVSSKVLTTDIKNQTSLNWQHIADIPIFYPGSTMGPCPTWRRSLHDKYGYFGSHFVIGDAKFWEAMHAGGEKFGVIDDNLILYYHNPLSLERRVNNTGDKLLKLDLDVINGQ